MELDHALTACWTVALPGPMRMLLTYRAPASAQAGARVQVPLGRRRSVVGVLWQITHEPEGDFEIKAVDAVLDPYPLLRAHDLRCLAWAADYYHAPLGDYVLAAFPPALRQGQVPQQILWFLTPAGRAALDSGQIRGAQQRLFLAALWSAADRGVALASEDLPAVPNATRNRLLALGWVSRKTVQAEGRWDEALPSPAHAAVQLNAAQQAAVDAVWSARAEFGVWLLDGVTGSGKTEVYLALIAQVVREGGQALVLVPEIGLTPQLVARFSARLGLVPAVLHSGLAEGERLRAWQAARTGQARVVIGTRSAVFQPMMALRLIVVDEEHDASFKQQEGLGYHARDVVIWRARDLAVPVVLGSATPSLESWRNRSLGRYRGLELPARARAGAVMPRMRLLDVRHQPMHAGLSLDLRAAIERHWQAGGQVMLFLNRRGYAQSLLCHACGWVADCPHCDAFMTWHRRAGRLRCHHCGHEQAVPAHCPACAAPLSAVGLGTEQLEDALTGLFPGAGIERLDRDALLRVGELDRRLARIASGQAQLIVGTQLLVKGHDFPGVTLVAVVDADQALFASDFRAPERFAQQLIQVAGRAGRADRLGEVLIQTHQPDHPGLQRLLRDGYGQYAEQLLAERAAAGLPPVQPAALLRADGLDAEAVAAILTKMADWLASSYPMLAVWGPVPAVLARRAGRYRFQLLLLAPDRPTLQTALHGLDAAFPQRRLAGLRWSIDVDPVEMA
ncbi:primosomal protein N' [Halothiobacillus sp. DCM-1]|uniref:primosomal protein N' n=1 Tax=Halothiobacillus sp. DCM-1 TaxID=3112558 RepID=UPI003254231C